MKEYNKKEPKNKNKKIVHNQDDESLRYHKTTKNFKRKKQSLEDEESWEDWQEYYKK